MLAGETPWGHAWGRSGLHPPMRTTRCHVPRAGSQGRRPQGFEGLHRGSALRLLALAFLPWSHSFWACLFLVYGSLRPRTTAAALPLLVLVPVGASLRALHSTLSAAPQHGQCLACVTCGPLASC